MYDLLSQIRLSLKFISISKKERYVKSEIVKKWDIETVKLGLVRTKERQFVAVLEKQTLDLEVEAKEKYNIGNTG